MAARSQSGWLKWVLVPVLAAGAYFGWRFYSKKADDGAPEFKVVAVTRGDITQTVSANGQINPLKTIIVGSQVSGMITDLRADYNSMVTNGQVIAQVDPSTYQRALVQADAELANAKSSLALANLNFRRAAELRTNDLISASEFDATEIARQQAQSNVKLREASLERAQVDLDRTTIVAPIDGIVISRAVEIGQTVAASFNTPTIFSIANDLRKMRIEAMVSEADVGGVQEGQPATFSVDAYAGREFRGTVTQVRFAPVTNQNVVNYTAVIEVSNDDLKLRPGMTATVNIITAQKKDALRIPNAALRFRPPENASIIGAATNSPVAGGASLPSTASAGRGGAGGEGAAPGGGTDASREERRRRMESLSPEERERMRAEYRARGGGAGGGRGPGGPGAASADGPVTRTLYLAQTNNLNGRLTVQLQPVTVKTGITDGKDTEAIEGVKEGDPVVSGLNLPTAATTAARPGASPFGGSPFGGGGGMRR